MASLSDSKTFQSFNKSAQVTSKMGRLLSTGVVLDKSYIEEQYLQISKTRVSPILNKILQAFNNGEIKLIWCGEKHLTIAVPFIVLTVGGKTSAYIFISDFSKMNKDGTALTIEMKKLYTLMESAYIGLKYFSNPGIFTKNGTFLKLNASMYSEMALRILNREYALSLDKDAYDSANYYIARFFLEKVIGLQNKELANAYAVGSCKTPNKAVMDLSEDLYNTNHINNIEDLVKFLANTNSKMGNLSHRYFFERWLAAYGLSACLGIDSYPYYYFMVSNVLVGGFLVNVTALNDIVKNASGIEKFYAEIGRIV